VLLVSLWAWFQGKAAAQAAPPWTLVRTTPDDQTVAERWTLTVQPPTDWTPRWLPDQTAEAITLKRGSAVQLFSTDLADDLRISLRSRGQSTERIVTVLRASLARQDDEYILNTEGDVNLAFWVMEQCTITIDLLRTPVDTLEADICRRGGTVEHVVP
jgi:hypothetical protein